MKNTFGNALQVTIFGESHGDQIGVILDGIPAGITLDMEFIKQQMEKRKAKGRISTQRHEADEVKIVSGYFEGKTTGAPIGIMIANTAQHSADYEKTKNRIRPSHADYSADVKYRGFQDYRGGGHFSGRITAPLTAAGAIAMQILKEKGITIASHILTCKTVHDTPFTQEEAALKKEMKRMNEEDIAVLNEQAKRDMLEVIEQAANDGDSVGGVLESVILGVPAGIGEPFFDSMESELSHLLFSVPAVKGVEFGSGFAFAEMSGSQANDSFYFDNGVKTRTNHNGGINGGITNGMPIRIKTVIKPTPSIYKPQETIDRQTHEPVILQIQGRHDPAIIHRARVVVDSVLALGVLDEWMMNESWSVRKG